MSQQDQLTAELQEKEQRYRESCWAWFCEQVITIDEATQRLRPWPADKEYLRELIEDILPCEKLVMIPKSRRLLITWLISGWVTWVARYHSANAIYWQNIEAGRAAYTLDRRSWHIEQYLADRDLRRREGHGVKVHRTHEGHAGRITYQHADDNGDPQPDSYIAAVPEGADVLRTFTPSIVVMDEVEHHRRAVEAMEALLPLLEEDKPVRAVLIGTSNGPLGLMAQYCSDIGFTVWRDNIRQRGVVVPRLRHDTGAAICPVHYSLDPSITTDWVDRQRRLYRDATSWGKEMEINMSSVSGNPVAASYTRLGNTLEHLHYMPALPIRLACDFNVDPMAWLICQYDKPYLYVIDEIFLEPGSVPTACDEVIDRYASPSGDKPVLWIYGDTAGHARQQGDKDNLSHYERMQLRLERHFRIQLKVPRRAPGVQAGIDAMNEMLCNKDGAVRLVVDRTACPELVLDLQLVVYDRDGKSIKKVTTPEHPYRKRTHLLDALRAICVREFPVGTAHKDDEKKKPKKKRPRKLIAEMPWSRTAQQWEDVRTSHRDKM